MRKLLYMAAVVLLGMTSCKKEDPFVDDPVVIDDPTVVVPDYPGILNPFNILKEDGVTVPVNVTAPAGLTISNISGKGGASSKVTSDSELATYTHTIVDEVDITLSTNINDEQVTVVERVSTDGNSTLLLPRDVVISYYGQTDGYDDLGVKDKLEFKFTDGQIYIADGEPVDIDFEVTTDFSLISVIGNGFLDQNQDPNAYVYLGTASATQLPIADHEWVNDADNTEGQVYSGYVKAIGGNYPVIVETTLTSSYTDNVSGQTHEWTTVVSSPLATLEAYKHYTYFADAQVVQEGGGEHPTATAQFMVNFDGVWTTVSNNVVDSFNITHPSSNNSVISYTSSTVSDTTLYPDYIVAIIDGLVDNATVASESDIEVLHAENSAGVTWYQLRFHGVSLGIINVEGETVTGVAFDTRDVFFNESDIGASGIDLNGDGDTLDRYIQTVHSLTITWSDGSKTTSHGSAGHTLDQDNS